MLIFQSPLLPGLHGVTVIDPRPSGAVRSCLHAVSIREFRPPVGKQDVDIFPEELRSEDGLQQVDALLHGKSCFFLVEEGEEEAWADKLKGLDKRAVRAIVIDGVHLGDKDLRMLIKISPVVFKSLPWRYLRLSLFLKVWDFFFGSFLETCRFRSMTEMSETC